MRTKIIVSFTKILGQRLGISLAKNSYIKGTKEGIQRNVS